MHTDAVFFFLQLVLMLLMHNNYWNYVNVINSRNNTWNGYSLRLIWIRIVLREHIAFHSDINSCTSANAAGVCSFYNEIISAVSRLTMMLAVNVLECVVQCAERRAKNGRQTEKGRAKERKRAEEEEKTTPMREKDSIFLFREKQEWEKNFTAHTSHLPNQSHKLQGMFWIEIVSLAQMKAVEECRKHWTKVNKLSWMRDYVSTM